MDQPTHIPARLPSAEEVGGIEGNRAAGSQPTADVNNPNTLQLAVTTVCAPSSSSRPLQVRPEAFPDAHECVDGLVNRLIVVLEGLINAGAAPEGSVPMSVFHSVRAPTISLREYLTRLWKYLGCTSECYVLAFIYLDRLLETNPHMAFGVLNCHRLLLCGLVIAAKFHDDIYYSNRFYANVGGLPVKELNALEGKMLQLLSFELVVDPQEFERYRVALSSC